jgi:hypothetical protein
VVTVAGSRLASGGRRSVAGEGLLWIRRRHPGKRLPSIGDAASDSAAHRLHAILPCSPLDEMLYRSALGRGHARPSLARDSHGVQRIIAASTTVVRTVPRPRLGPEPVAQMSPATFVDVRV